MTDGYWSYDSAVFPLPSLAEDNTAVLKLADPVLNELCSFFTSVLNKNLSQRFSDESAACQMTNATLNNWKDGVTVAETVAFPLNPMLLKTTAFKFPLLSIYTEGGEYTSITLNKPFAKKRDLVVSWILPPLTPLQYNRLYSFTEVISDAISIAAVQGIDPSDLTPTQSVWKNTGLSFGTLNGYSNKPYLGMDTNGKNAYFPSTQIRLSFWEHSNPVLSNYNKLTSMYLEEDLVDGSNPAAPIKNFVDGYIYPNMSIASASPSSGSIAGNTWINIVGTGFSSSLIKYPRQITVCGAPAKDFVIINPSVLRVITNPNTAGLGDIVITNTDNSVVKLSNSYTYT